MSKELEFVWTARGVYSHLSLRYSYILRYWKLAIIFYKVINMDIFSYKNPL